MRKKITNWLVRFAVRINPQQTVPVFEKEEVYKPMTCSSAYSIGKKDIKTYKKDTGEKSTRAAMRTLIKKAEDKAKHDLFYAIENNDLQKMVYTKDGDTVVELRCNLYVCKKD